MSGQDMTGHSIISFLLEDALSWQDRSVRAVRALLARLRTCASPLGAVSCLSLRRLGGSCSCVSDRGVSSLYYLCKPSRTKDGSEGQAQRMTCGGC